MLEELARNPDRALPIPALERRTIADHAVSSVLAVAGPLVAALGADGAIFSRHFFDARPPSVLARFGDPDVGDDVLQGVLRRAVRLDLRRAADRDSFASRAWQEVRGTEARLVLSIALAREQDSALVCSAVFFGDEHAIDRGAIATALHRLAPMMNAYFGLWQQHRQQSSQVEGMRAALNSLGLGIVLVDDQGAAVFANAFAERLFRDGAFVRQRGGSIAARHLGDTMKLQAILAAAIGSNLGEVSALQSSANCMLKLTADDRRLIIAAVPAEAPAREPGTVAAILIMNECDESGGAIQPVCELYGLSVVESRLAGHLIAGRSLQEACVAMRVKEQTARTYLKNIFLKTNVKRQADLVRLLLSSLVPLCPRSLKLR